MDRIAEAARAPPPRDVAPAFHLPRTSNSSRETLENSSSESSDTDLAGTPPSACSASIPSLSAKKMFTLRFPRRIMTTSCQRHPGSVTMGGGGNGAFLSRAVSTSACTRTPLTAYFRVSGWLKQPVRHICIGGWLWFYFCFTMQKKERGKRFGVCYSPLRARCVG